MSCLQDKVCLINLSEMVSDEFDLEIQRAKVQHLIYIVSMVLFPSSRVENDLKTYLEPNLKIQIFNLDTLKIIFTL